MSLELYFHPLSSFCWKVLAALYENATPFAPRVVDLGDERARAAFLAIWPIGKFPVLRDLDRGRVVPESSVIIEYLEQHHPGRARLLPADPAAALETRLWDRFYDLHVQDPMQKIVGDRLRPPGANDRHGVDAARARLRTAYAVVEREASTRSWAAGDTFSMADCAAAPALYYANRVEPIGDEHPNASALLARLLARPSVARVLREAEPYFRSFPIEDR